MNEASSRSFKNKLSKLPEDAQKKKKDVSFERASSRKSEISRLSRMSKKKEIRDAKSQPEKEAGQ